MRRQTPIYEPDPFPSVRAKLAPNQMKRISVRAAVRSDRGLERANNEDRAAFADLGDVTTSVTFQPPAGAHLVPELGAFVALVCDGMGGEAGGEVASRLAVESVIPFLRSVSRANNKNENGSENENVSENAIAHAMVAAIDSAAARIKEEARIDPTLARMGTTATLAVIASSSAGGAALLCAQVGDSRAYLLRKGAGGDEATSNHPPTLTQLTQDQTMFEFIRQSGNVPLDEIDGIVGAHIILQAVGSSKRLDVAITRTPLKSGDTILLCSDGLHGFVSDHIIATALAEHEDDADEACEELIKRTLEAGAPDNVTCIVFHVGDL